RVADSGCFEGREEGTRTRRESRELATEFLPRINADYADQRKSAFIRGLIFLKLRARFERGKDPPKWLQPAKPKMPMDRRLDQVTGLPRGARLKEVFHYSGRTRGPQFLHDS